MNVLWFYAIAFIIIWVLALLFRKQLKIDVEGPILMRRTGRLRGFIDNVAQRHPLFWKRFMNVGIPVSIIFMVVVVYSLLTALPTLFSAPTTQLILPGVTLPGQLISVPLLEGLIGLATVIIIHEFGHGILARVEGVRIKSIGVLLLAVLPGAFVEPDEEDVEKSGKKSKLRIYAAGSVFNLTLAAVAFLTAMLLSLLFINGLALGIPGVSVPGAPNLKTEPINIYNNSNPIAPLYHTDGVKIDSTVPKMPADGVLQPGSVIESINGQPTTNFAQFEQILAGVKVGDTITLQTNQGIYTLKTVANPNNASKSFLGVNVGNDLAIKPAISNTWGNILPWIPYVLNDYLFWIFFLNFAVGIINLLPARPLDGGLIFEELLTYRISKATVDRITSGLSIFLWSILIVGIVYGTGKGIAMLF